MNTYLSRSIVFSSAHRYFQPKFSEEKNKEVFGRCYTKYGHGHNYLFEVTLMGPVDVDTGMVMNLYDVDKILKKVTDPLDHHHLNNDVPYFADVVPTTENIAKYLFHLIEKELPKGIKIVRSRLHEAQDLWADYYG